MRLIASIVAVSLIATSSIASGLLNPMDYKHTNSQKEQVMKDIEKHINFVCTGSYYPSCDEITISYIREENIHAFEYLTHAKNREIMDRVIRKCCDEPYDQDTCDYVTIASEYDWYVDNS